MHIEWDFVRSNLDLIQWTPIRGKKVIFNTSEWRNVEPIQWKNIGTVIGIELDKELTSMNRKNIKMYRIHVDFGHPEIASLLPQLLVPLDQPTYHAHNLHDFQHNGQAFVVGNGHAESDRSNALELDFDGNMHLEGDLTIHDGDHDHISLKDIHDRLEKLEQLLGGCKCSASIFNCQDADALKVQFNTVVSQQNSCDSL